MIIGLWVLSPPRPDGAASYALRVPRAGILRTASFRFRLTADTLAVRLMIPITGAHRGLPPPSDQRGAIPPWIAKVTLRIMPGAQTKRPENTNPALFSYVVSREEFLELFQQDRCV